MLLALAYWPEFHGLELPHPISASGYYSLKNRRVDRAWDLEVQGIRAQSA